MKVEPVKPKSVITMKTTDKNKQKTMYQWWLAKSDKDRSEQILATATYLKENQGYRSKQAATYARLYGNLSLFAFLGASAVKMDQLNTLPADRPTFNLIQSASDTLVSRISQNRPSPVFLTDNSDYKERRLAKQLNNFIQGEFYQTKAYEKGAIILRDALVEGTGCVKVYETADEKVGLERVLLTELFVDPNEAIYGEPRQLYQLKLVDRQVLLETFPDFKKQIEEADRATVDQSADSNKSISDLVLVVEAWHLRSGKNAKDGRHTIACSGGIIHDEPWEKDKFPFVFLHYSPRLLGFWAQGLAEQLMGIQMEINSLLYTIHKAIRLVGVPRIFVEQGSKVAKTAFNNEIGTIISFTGVKPSYEVAQCVPQEIYAQLQRLIEYGYQQSGVSAMQAAAQKPAGLNSGEAIRSYDDISTDRFAALARRYDTMFIDLAYLVTDVAMDIAKRTGKYTTVYPNKNGTKQIDLPKMSLLKDPFVIQCFNMSSLPKDPAGRLAKVTEMIQAGMLTIKEGRRLLDYPDLEQVERLANASEERIYQYLDMIVEDGKFNPPDPFMDLKLAQELCVQYYNLYVPAKLEEERAQYLRDFHSQCGTIVAAGVPQRPGVGAPPATPQALPEALPTSPLIPNAPGASPMAA